MSPPGLGRTWSTMAGTEKIMASLNTGLVSPLFTAVFFLLIFLPSCSRYTLTKGSARRAGEGSVTCVPSDADKAGGLFLVALPGRSVLTGSHSRGANGTIPTTEPPSPAVTFPLLHTRFLALTTTTVSRSAVGR